MRDTLLPETVLRIRAAHGLTQHQVALRLGVSQVSVSNWERGVHPVPPVAALRAQQIWPEECHEGDARERR